MLFTEVFDIGLSSSHSFLVGVNDRSSSSLFKIFPNPSNGVFQWTGNMQWTDATIEIYNVLGEKVFNKPVLQSGSQTHEIDISRYPKGIYIVKFTAGEKIYTEKVVVQ